MKLSQEILAPVLVGSNRIVTWTGSGRAGRGGDDATGGIDGVPVVDGVLTCCAPSVDSAVFSLVTSAGREKANRLPPDDKLTACLELE